MKKAQETNDTQTPRRTLALRKTQTTDNTDTCNIEKLKIYINGVIKVWMLPLTHLTWVTTYSLPSHQTYLVFKLPPKIIIFKFNCSDKFKYVAAGCLNGVREILKLASVPLC